MPDWLTDLAAQPWLLSYGGLFVLAFLSASLLPMGSAWLVLLLLSQGESPLLVWLIATAGNTLGSVLNYALGYYARHWVQARQSRERWQQAERWFDRYGIWSMLLAWLPIIGDPLTLVAGVLRANFPLFLILVTLGKAARYAVLIAGYLAVAPGS
ncbi:DedA family protein [Venatoribacter cucullus]|uniref:DedA family protein n=1 Tax=Venatoribacter cucullus TaxID=2661630 RepID=A0A9X7UT64_9GAMM|nr:YqaA family protein [Venatoribacter cucullus]QQD20534.1 DedA family protein [Oceanospirillaceae bacterium ASx5O]QQD23237.1 DedA family protein [Venatoribacter cucullus]